MAPHHWFVQPLVGLYISFGVGCCFIHSKGNARAREWDKAISSHTFFFTRYSLGIGLAITILIMKENKLIAYETPQVEVINLELEQAVLQGSDHTVTNPDMEWGY